MIGCYFIFSSATLDAIIGTNLNINYQSSKRRNSLLSYWILNHKKFFESKNSFIPFCLILVTHIERKQYYKRILSKFVEIFKIQSNVTVNECEYNEENVRGEEFFPFTFCCTCMIYYYSGSNFRNWIFRSLEFKNLIFIRVPWLT